ncbi:MAG TPA: CopD family protein, partial [Pyrinomonadaceae bacterium]
TEELEPGLTTIGVRDEQGNRIDKGTVALSEDNKKAAIEVGELRAGVYTVTWKTVSADQHVIHGSFVFSAASTGTAATSSSPQTLQSGHVAPPTPMVSDDQGEQISFAQIFVRWLSYLAMITLFGGFAFRSLILIPALRDSHDGTVQADARTATESRVLVLLWISIIVLAITSLAALAQQASALFGGALSLSLWIRVLRTGYGASWILQVTSVAIIGIILFLLRRQIKGTPLNEHSTFWWLGLAASATLLIAPSWTGHAVASGKDFRLAVFTDWLHLITGGFWVGGLFHLALTLRVALTSVPEPERATVVYHLITRFTRVAIPSVVLLALAGLYNTWAHIPGFKAFWITPYGKTLTLKLVLVGVMLFLGALNNFYFGKRAKRLVEARTTNLNEGSASRFERSLRRSVALEAALGVLVLLVTAIVVFLTPARSHPSMTSSKAEQDVIVGRR